MLSARRAVMLSEGDGATKAEHYILEGVTDALFLVFETSTIEC